MTVILCWSLQALSASRSSDRHLVDGQPLFIPVQQLLSQAHLHKSTKSPGKLFTQHLLHPSRVPEEHLLPCMELDAYLHVDCAQQLAALPHESEIHTESWAMTTTQTGSCKSLLAWRPRTKMDTTPEPPAPRETRPARRTYSDGSRGKSNSTCL